MAANRENGIIFDTIAIFGVGLIGGSLGMAARNRGLANHVIGVGRNEDRLRRAMIVGAIDDYSMDLQKGTADADLVVICTPVLLIAPTLANMADYLKPGAVITDVGSTKSVIVDECESVTPEGCYFVGGHPMAGSEQTGVEAAAPDLYEGATWVVTNSANTDVMALGKLTALAEAVGANVEIMDPKSHDAAVAIISHLPHIMSGALLQTAETGQRETGKVFELAAGSFKDLTRISGSSPEIWRDICMTNPELICRAMERFQKHMDEFKAVLQNRDEAEIERFFEQVKEIRETYLRIAG